MSQNYFAELYPSLWGKGSKTKHIMKFAEGYKDFLNTCKTERETAAEIVRLARDAGFKNLDDLYAAGTKLVAGDKVYALRQNKAVALFVIGKKDLTEGLRLLAAHMDAPRLDLRPNPLYEKDGYAVMKTHYYGGIKKYQWVAQPLALHGTVVKKGGKHVDVAIGENESEPVVYISDLPAHLSAKQREKTMAEGIAGEDLNIIVGSMPLEGKSDEPVKKFILKLLKDKYDIEEKDFVSAEFEVVPAGKARDAGLDGSLIASYAQDDRICVYTALKAVLETENPDFTAGAFFVDKEEVGSQGNAGMNSHYMENLTARLTALAGGNEMSLRLALENSMLLSADVTLGYDPHYPECFEVNNTARLGSGPVFTKYAGSKGKSGCNDANAEFLAFVRDVFDDAEVQWQTGGYGRIDLGGGGTIAPFASRYGMHVLDCGVALLSMHAPYELSSKADVYETARAYAAFLKSGADIKKYL
ncbi:MAG: aminopeptidase [Pyramidobacter sp.]|jgi:aspartyl aminopeptidase